MRELRIKTPPDKWQIALPLVTRTRAKKIKRHRPKPVTNGSEHPLCPSRGAVLLTSRSLKEHETSELPTQDKMRKREVKSM